jgi:hypothetical protein
MLHTKVQLRDTKAIEGGIESYRQHLSIRQ